MVRLYAPAPGIAAATAEQLQFGPSPHNRIPRDAAQHWRSPLASTSVFYIAAQYAVWFFAYSFIGWVFEEVYTLLKLGKAVNRGFVTGPVLPIYGVGALMAVVLLSPLPNPAAQFVVGCLAAAVMEYATSWAMEKLFHARWWDYTDMPLNLNGRICLPGILLFGLMMLGVNLVLQPLFERATALVPPDVLEFAATCLTVLFAIDCAVTVMRMQHFSERLDVLQLRILDAASEKREMLSGAAAEGKARLSDMAAEGRDLLVSWARSALSGQPRPNIIERRAMRNPYFKPVRNGEAFEWLKTHTAGRADGAGGPDGSDDGAERPEDRDSTGR